MHKLILLASVGACGTLTRYFLQGWVQRLFGGELPWGTLAVNSLGCFAFGLIWAIAEERFLIKPELRTILLIGFLGSFTTFSSFIFETAELFRDTQWQMAILNLVGQNVLGLILFFVGLFLGRIL
ncbi:MAG: fluoride efflux transporter CrcB [Terriglobia bacterium]